MNLGFIGLGDLGHPMALRLLERQEEAGGLVLWNRSRTKMAPLARLGAWLAASPREVMQRSEIVGLCLTSDEAVEQVCEGGSGLFAGRNPDLGTQTIVDFSTGAPHAARHMARRAAELGLGWVDAPVSGGVAAAQQGRLTVFAGGETHAVQAAQPMLSRLASHCSHMGPAGSGQAVKLCNQLIVSCNVIAIAEAIALARRAGVDVARLPAALRGGFADSTPLQVFGPRMVSPPPGPRLGSTALMHKDMCLIRDMASAVGATTPLAGLVLQRYAQAVLATGIGADADLSSVIRLYEEEIPQ